MRLRVIATDYDGTIATDGVLEGRVREAIAKARQRGVLVVIVTGRILSELRSVVGCLDFVDGVVAENDSRTPMVIETPRLSRKQESDRLHHALVSISRGLLQYTSQCAPWTPPSENHRDLQLIHLAAMQQDSIQQLCDVLIERREAIAWGDFPTEYMSYNYVSLDFLWPKIAESQSRLVLTLESVRKELQHDPQATAVLDNIIQTESNVLNGLTTRTNEASARPVSIAHRQIVRADPMQRSAGRWQGSAV